MITRKCDCGQLASSNRAKYCQICKEVKTKERRRLDAVRFRKIHGSAVSRGIHCSSCKGIKEHQERGYCLACERARYKLRSKPECAICNALKDNLRDSYCNACKRQRAKTKSMLEGRRFKNPEGRKSTCSNCGREKDKSNLDSGYCMTCKIHTKKKNRHLRSPEQIMKDSARKIAYHTIKKGVLIKQPCEVCGEVKVDAHHDDYTKPLDIRWLCRKHHLAHHREIK